MTKIQDFNNLSKKLPYLGFIQKIKKNPSILNDVSLKFQYDDVSYFLFSLIQRRMKWLLESFVNSYDLGLDGRQINDNEIFFLEKKTLQNTLLLISFFKNYEKSGLEQLEEKISECVSEKPLSENDLAQLLSIFYSSFQGFLTEIDPMLKKSNIQIPSILKTKEYVEEDFDYRKPIIDLTDFIIKRKWAFHSIFLHGSYSTLDYVKGCSDLDTFAILKNEVVCSPNNLIKLRKNLLPIWKFFYQVDPLQHHGIMLTSELDLNFYPQSFFPTILLNYSKTLYSEKQNILIHERTSNFEDKQSFFQLAQNITNFTMDWNTLSIFRLKFFLQLLLLFPTLYFQAKGENMYKKYSFQQLRSDFEKMDFSALNIASEIRLNNRYKIFQSSLNQINLNLPPTKMIKLIQTNIHNRSIPSHLTQFLRPTFNDEVYKFVKVLTSRINYN